MTSVSPANGSVGPVLNAPAHATIGMHTNGVTTTHTDPESRVFLAPVCDDRHSEDSLCFLLTHLVRDDDTVHLLVVVPATHPTSAMAYGGPMVPPLVLKSNHTG